MKYAWLPGPKYELSAQVFGETMERLAKGRDIQIIPPQEIVAEARKKKSPIHKGWNWDVEHAAELHWREIARGYVQRLSIVRVRVEGEPPTSDRALYSIVKDGQRGYATPKYIMSDRDLQLQMLATAHRELLIYLNKYRQLTTAFGKYVPKLEEITDAMAQEIDNLTRQVAA